MSFITNLCFRPPRLTWTAEEYSDHLIWIPNPRVSWRIFSGVFTKISKNLVKSVSTVQSKETTNESDSEEQSISTPLKDTNPQKLYFSFVDKLKFFGCRSIPCMVYNSFTRFKPVVLFFHGNSEDIGTSFMYCSLLHQSLGVVSE